MTTAASLFVLAVPLLVAATWCVWSINRAPLTGPDTSPLDRRDGVGRCTQRVCPGRATVRVTDHTGRLRLVCAPCFEAGIRHGWWGSFATAPFDRELSDREVRELHDARRRATGESA